MTRFEIIEKDPMQPNGPQQSTLVEIGPRFVLTPIRIFEGAFGGATVYSNPGKRLCLLVTNKVMLYHLQNLYHRRLFDRC